MEFAVKRRNIDQMFKYSLAIVILWEICVTVAFTVVVSYDGIFLFKIGLDIIQFCLNCSRLIAGLVFIASGLMFSSISTTVGITVLIEMYLGLQLGKHLLDKSVSLRYKKLIMLLLYIN